MKYIVFFLIFVKIGYSQNLEYYKDIRINMIDSTIQFKENVNNLKWISLLPSIGYNKSTGLNISISANSFVRYIQQKQRNKIEIERYRFEKLNRLDDEIIRIEDKILQLEIDVKVALAKTKNLELLHQLYVIDSLSSQNNELPYSAWLQSKYNYSIAWQSYYKSYLELSAKKSSLTLKYKIPLTHLSLDISSFFNHLKTLKP